MTVAQLRPVERRSAEAQATDSLRDAIVSGALAQGERITEIDLSKRMNISRATIRAALHLLATEGLVIQIPYTGWTVMSLTPVDIWELFTLRASLESLAGRLAAERLDALGRERLIRASDALAAACGSNDHRVIADADFKLHETIVDLSGHGRLATEYRVLKQQVRLYINASDALISDGAVVMAQHEPIVRAILERDQALAARLSEEHNLHEGGVLLARAERMRPADDRSIIA